MLFGYVNLFYKLHKTEKLVTRYKICQVFFCQLSKEHKFRMFQKFYNYICSSS